MNDVNHTPRTEELRREARLLQHLVDHPPWKQPYEPFDIDTAVRAAFRRWAPAEGFPSLLMIHAVWDRASKPDREWLDSLPTDRRDAAISRIARALHLFALAAEDGPALHSFGAACAYIPSASRGPVVSNNRFARLLNAPPEDTLRLEALSRAFRHFRQKGIRVQGTDARNLLVFLFGEYPKPVISRWASDYFRHTTEETTSGSPETDSAVQVSSNTA